LAIGDIAEKWGSDPQISSPLEASEALSNTVLLGTARISLPNGISFRPTGCTSVTDGQITDGQTDHVTVASVAIGGFQRCCLIIIITRSAGIAQASSATSDATS